MSANAASSPTPLLRRVLLAQESGLVLVIALLMAVLTVFGGSKPRVDRILLPETAAVTGGDSEVITIVRDSANKTTYAASDGWEYRGGGRGGLLLHKREVNKFLDVDNLFLQLVYASFIAVMAVGMTAIIAMGGIDLSIGSIYAVAALFGAIWLRYDWGKHGFPHATVLGSGLLWWVFALGGVSLACGASLWARLKKASETRLSAGNSAAMTRNLAMALGCVLMVIALWRISSELEAVGADQAARSMMQGWASVPLGLLVCCCIGAAAGWFNGVMIVGLRVHPFIISLGTMAAYRGLVAIPTKAQSVGTFPESFTQGFFKLSAGGINPVPPAVMLLVALGGAFVLGRTVLGRRVYAIGGNEIAAGYAGIPVGRVKIAVYTIMGALAGLSATLYLGYLGAAETNAGNGYELKVIAATVIGGASLSGGRGTAFGAVLGALLIQLIENGMLILNIDQNYNQIVMGAAIVIAVVLDQLKTRLLPQGR